MKWAPSVKINPNFDESVLAAKRHLAEIKVATAGENQVFVNLIDKKGSQLRIGEEFKKLML